MKSEESLGERMARVEGILEQMSVRLNHIEGALDSKADKWEIRIWFLVIIAFMATLRFI